MRCSGGKATASKKRASGVLLHITSLPSAFGIGDLGPESFRFADLLAAQKQRCWSILPLSPTRLTDGNSPYQASSAYAGNPLLISPELLAQDGFLPKAPMPQPQRTNRVNFQAVYQQKQALLNSAYHGFKASGRQACEFRAFCEENSRWLNDFALYAALHAKSGLAWHQWPPSLRRRQPEAISRKLELHKMEVEQVMFSQYLFFRQWRQLKAYCRSKRIQIVGDLPFYVAYDSADVWVHPELFRLYKNGKPRYVGGVPPDYFSASGQLWGNPVYDWPRHEETGFEWWIERIHHSLTLYDKLRLDHFRGFVAYWRVPARAATAQSGRWIKAPAEVFFAKVKAACPKLPFIAEDLGYIDEPVKKVIHHLGVPGMRVMLFGFDDQADNPHLIKNHPANSVVYTGTHDTNTVRGWYTEEATAKERQVLSKATGGKVTEGTVSAKVVELAASSASDLCIVPLQDVLGLGAMARMNNPRYPTGNWAWRVTKRQLEGDKLAMIGDLSLKFGRA